MRFLRHLKAHNVWAKANDAWITGLLPRGGLIHLKALGLHTFVVKPYHCAALTWAAQEVGPNVWRKDPSICALEWHTIFSADDVEVLPTKFVSPMHLRVKDQELRCPS